MTAILSDEEARSAFAAVALFGSEPTDRALDGWGGDGWLAEELAALREYAKEAAR